MREFRITSLSYQNLAGIAYCVGDELFRPIKTDRLIPPDPLIGSPNTEIPNLF